MSKKDDIVDPQLNEVMVNMKLAKMAGATNDPYQRFLTSMGLSRFDGGKTAAKFINLQRRFLLGKAMSNLLAGPRPPRLPRVNAKTAILLGYEVKTQRPVLIDRNTLIYHTLVLGESGMGKSYLTMSIIAQINRQNHQGEESTK